MSHGDDSVVLLIRVPHDNEYPAEKFDELLDHLHDILKGGRFSLEIASIHQHVYLFVWCSRHEAEHLSGHIYAEYPDAEIDVVKDYAQVNLMESGVKFVGAELNLERTDLYPIRTYKHFEGTSVSAVFALLAKAQEGEQGWIQIVLGPGPEKGAFTIGRKLKMKAQNIANKFNIAKFFRTKSRSELIKKEREAAKSKSDKDSFYVTIRFAYLSQNLQVARQKLLSLAKVFLQFKDPDLNSFEMTRMTESSSFLQSYCRREFGDNKYLLNTEEIATLYHLPKGGKSTVPSLVCTVSKKAEPPMDLPKEGTAPPSEISFFGVTNFHNQYMKFGMKRADRRRHLYVVGKSGVGKSKLLELLILSDIHAGKGVAVLDPHGDLVEDLMRYIPEERIDDVIYFNPADMEYPIGFNPIESVEPQYRQHVAMGFIEIFKKLFGANWTPRLEHVLRYTVLALFDYPNSTVFGILKMLTDKNYRQKVVARVEDPTIKNFWVNEFAAWSEKFDNEAIMPVLNKVGQFVSTSLVRNIVGQPKNTMNMCEIMDKQKILLMSVSKGNLSEEISTLLGSMVITSIYQAAMKRAAISEEERKDFYFYVDEFHNFATKTFAEILSEARKYRLNLTVSHQHIGQLSQDIHATVFGNVGSMIAFRVGAEDANLLEKEFSPIFHANDIINLGVQEFYLKMSIDGQLRDPFSGKTLTVPAPTKNLREKIVELSRKKYGRPRAAVEKMIEQMDRGYDEGPGEVKGLGEEKFVAPLV